LTDAAAAGRPPLISVVVPTRDRPKALGRCLAALAAQTGADRLEVVVVDDGSKSVREVSAVVAQYPCARALVLPGRGPAAARNAGANAARGEIICFTDDDCVPEPDWAEQLADAVNAGADVVAGVTISAGGSLAGAAELVARAPAAVEPFAPSNNVACSRKVVGEVPFDESYPRAAGEDRAWCAQIARAGYVLRSEPRARLVHCQQLTVQSFFRRQLHYGEGAYLYRRGERSARRLEPPAFYLSLMRDAFAAGFTVGLLVAAAQLATAAGFVRESVRARRARAGLRQQTSDGGSREAESRPPEA